MHAGYSIHMGRMHNNNLEIRIAGSSCRLQKVKEVPQIIDDHSRIRNVITAKLIQILSFHKQKICVDLCQ